MIINNSKHSQNVKSKTRVPKVLLSMLTKIININEDTTVLIRVVVRGRGWSQSLRMSTRFVINCESSQAHGFQIISTRFVMAVR